MKKWKTVSAIALALVMVTLAACGAGGSRVGESKTPSGSSAMKGQDYQSVEKKFEEKGFTNIRMEKLEDLITGWLTKDGEVESVTVGGNEDYSADTWVAADTEVVITYHTFPTESDNTSPQPEISDAPTTQDVVLPESGSKLDKDFDTKSSSTVYYINVDGQTNIPKLTEWKSAKVTDGVSEYLDYLENQGYVVTVTETDYSEPYSGYHLYNTKFSVKNDNILWTMALTIQDENYVEYELDINLP